MARQQGTFPFSSNFEVKTAGTLDARQLVDDFADLLAFTLEDNFIPNGFTVSVKGTTTPSERGLYQCIDNQNLSNAASWEKIGSGGGQSPLTFESGLTEIDSVVTLEGQLNKDTELLSYFDFRFKGNNINFENLSPLETTILSNFYSDIALGRDEFIIYSINSTEYIDSSNRTATIIVGDGIDGGSTFFPTIFITIQDETDAFLENLKFEVGSNPTGWTGATIANDLSYLTEIRPYDNQFVLVAELDFNSPNLSADILILDMVNKVVTKFSTLIPEIGNFLYAGQSNNDLIAKHLFKDIQIIKNTSSAGDFKLFFFDRTTNTAYSYNTVNSTKSSISIGDVTTGAITTVPSNIVNIKPLYEANLTNPFDGTKLIIETDDNNSLTRYLLYDFSSNSLEIYSESVSSASLIDSINAIPNLESDLIDVTFRFTSGRFTTQYFTKTKYFAIGSRGYLEANFNTVTNYLNSSGNDSIFTYSDIESGLSNYTINAQVTNEKISISLNGQVTTPIISTNVAQVLKDTIFISDSAGNGSILTTSSNFSIVNYENISTVIGLNDKGWLYPSTYEPELDNLVTRRWGEANLKVDAGEALRLREGALNLGGPIKNKISLSTSETNDLSIQGNLKLEKNSLSLDALLVTDLYSRVIANGTAVLLVDVADDYVRFIPDIVSPNTFTDFTAGATTTGYTGQLPAGNITNATFSADNITILFLYDDGSIWQANTNTTTISQLTASGEVIDSVALITDPLFISSYLEQDFATESILIASGSGDIQVFTRDKSSMRVNASVGTGLTGTTIQSGTYYDAKFLTLNGFDFYAVLAGDTGVYIINADPNSSAPVGAAQLFDENGFSGTDLTLLGSSDVTLKGDPFTLNQNVQNKQFIVGTASSYIYSLYDTGGSVILETPPSEFLYTGAFTEIRSIYATSNSNFYATQRGGYLYKIELDTSNDKYSIKYLNSSPLFDDMIFIGSIPTTAEDKILLVNPTNAFGFDRGARMYNINTFEISLLSNGFRYPTGYVPIDDFDLVTKAWAEANLGGGGSFTLTDGVGTIANGSAVDLGGFGVLTDGVGFGLTTEDSGVNAVTPGFSMYKDATFNYMTFGSADGSNQIIYDENGALIGSGVGLFVQTGTEGLKYATSPISIQANTILDKNAADGIYANDTFSSQTLTAQNTPGSGLIYDDLRAGVGGNAKTGIRYTGFGEAGLTDETGVDYSTLVFNSLAPVKYVQDYVTLQNVLDGGSTATVTSPITLDISDQSVTYNADSVQALKFGNQVPTSPREFVWEFGDFSDASVSGESKMYAYLSNDPVSDNYDTGAEFKVTSLDRTVISARNKVSNSFGTFPTSARLRTRHEEVGNSGLNFMQGEIVSQLSPTPSVQLKLSSGSGASTPTLDSVFRLTETETLMRYERNLTAVQSLSFGDGLGMIVTDTINSRGLENAADFSANYTLRSLIDNGYALATFTTKNTAFVTVTGTTYTVLESDNAKILLFTNAGGCTVTLPDALSIGHNFIAQNKSTGTITFSAETTLNSSNGNTLTGQYNHASLYKETATIWVGIFN